ncbi:MAG TPA: coproporphyrinogen-III oxidase family protein, partial [Tepidisphaeraceae bacterium]|nr:coproporphyrinogen-III oxidase family protein [Tepidisphaeraceae bacterium]
MSSGPNFVTHSPTDVINGLYVHIPFCFHKCHYCDFYSITRQNVERMHLFVDRLIAEAEHWLAKPNLNFKPKTVFFGGGTPSLLPIEEMSRLIKRLHQRIDFSTVSEWTVEVNPATASFEYCQMLRSNGVDRISFGAQSFNKTELSTLERHHDPDDVPNSIALARSAGFERLNVDLIYAIPGQDLASWENSLSSAIDLKLSHYSCYGLTYEPNTPIAVRRRLGLL